MLEQRSGYSATAQTIFKNSAFKGFSGPSRQNGLKGGDDHQSKRRRRYVLCQPYLPS